MEGGDKEPLPTPLPRGLRDRVVELRVLLSKLSKAAIEKEQAETASKTATGSALPYTGEKVKEFLVRLREKEGSEGAERDEESDGVEIDNESMNRVSSEAAASITEKGSKEEDLNIEESDGSGESDELERVKRQLAEEREKNRRLEARARKDGRKGKRKQTMLSEEEKEGESDGYEAVEATLKRYRRSMAKYRKVPLLSRIFEYRIGVTWERYKSRWLKLYHKEAEPMLQFYTIKAAMMYPRAEIPDTWERWMRKIDRRCLWFKKLCLPRLRTVEGQEAAIELEREREQKMERRIARHNSLLRRWESAKKEEYKEIVMGAEPEPELREPERMVARCTSRPLQIAQEDDGSEPEANDPRGNDPNSDLNIYRFPYVRDRDVIMFNRKGEQWEKSLIQPTECCIRPTTIDSTQKRERGYDPPASVDNITPNIREFKNMQRTPSVQQTKRRGTIRSIEEGRPATVQGISNNPSKIFLSETRWKKEGNPYMYG